MITKCKDNIVKYSKQEMDNFQGGKVIVFKFKKDLDEFIKNSTNRTSNKKLYFGKIDNNLALKILNKTGINIENYNISLKTDAIRHILNHHSKKEKVLRGQIPISLKDFKLVLLLLVTIIKFINLV